MYYYSLSVCFIIYACMCAVALWEWQCEWECFVVCGGVFEGVVFEGGSMSDHQKASEETVSGVLLLSPVSFLLCRLLYVILRMFNLMYPCNRGFLSQKYLFWLLRVIGCLHIYVHLFHISHFAFFSMHINTWSCWPRIDCLYSYSHILFWVLSPACSLLPNWNAFLKHFNLAIRGCLFCSTLILAPLPSSLLSLDKTFVLFWGADHAVPMFRSPLKES